MLRIALIVFALYAAYAVLAFAFQRELLFAGRRRAEKPPVAALAAGIERIWFTLASGARIEALYLPAPAGGAARGPALLFAHGNAELIEGWTRPFAEMRDLGLAVLLVEYPGYGRSDGQPSEASVSEAMAAGYDWLAARPEVDRTRIVGFGRSLGGGAICTLVPQRPLAALVLASTFVSVRSFAAGMGLPPFLVRDPFDNLAAVERFQGPVLIVHGTRDGTIGYVHGQRLARSAKHGRLISYESDHNDCPPDWPGFVGELGVFLRAHGVLSSD